MADPAQAHPAHAGAEPVVRLVEEIAVQFEHRPPDAAAAEIAAHLRRFWDPRMRRRLVDAVAAGAVGDPVVVRVAQVLAPGVPAR
ncbi:formate dehydrogenase subunit delta [Pseudonocardia benzenivorans]|uniref:Formate dehydrogenase subunit delta n=2 Tax=Pseudonocardia TaxID=1847 RepID=F4CRF2_PSEUX|nr:formate dehydrogenase subunit delta [Pseudonocardia dioxanivorans]AEA25243.1 hypothetical protein Psed_3044 [Pseudonocardia dioxanivorans CB1190]GJF04024.1 hypothetical protein PSD17_29820 [Pseudonocardia sp. D17]